MVINPIQSGSSACQQLEKVLVFVHTTSQTLPQTTNGLEMSQHVFAIWKESDAEWRTVVRVD